jgi:signal transduction histidine kinase
VSVRVTGSGAVVTVCDDGTGIPIDTLARVREPFFSTKVEGTGLGLAIAERAVRAHGGTMEIETAPGAGTTVRVRLPLCAGGRPASA